MQNKPFGPYKIEFTSRELPGKFPLEYFHYDQRDRPITSLHRHNYLEIGYCHHGSGIFIVEDKILPFTAGDVAVINDRELHLAQSTRGTVSRWTFVDCDPVRLLGGMVGTDRHCLNTGLLGGPGFKNIFPASRYPGIRQLATEILAELEVKRTGYQSAVRGLVWALMVRFHRAVPAGPDRLPASPAGVPLERVSPALAFLANQFRDPVRVAGCASLCHMSITNFRRVFLKAVGRTPQQYLMHLRIQTAALLLQTTDKPVLDISLEAGYDSLSSFNRNFKKLMGASPRQWRQAGTRPGPAGSPQRAG